MWNPSDLPGSLGAASQRMLRAGAAVFALALALALSGPVLAQPSAPSAETRQDLRQILEKSYEVLPLHNGVVLRPRKERLGVRTIEVSGDTIAINGERVSDGVLRAWLAADAEPILRLRRIPPRERQALFGLQAGAEVPEAPEPPEAPEAVDEPAGETEIPAEGELPAEAPDGEIPEAPVPPEAPDEPDDVPSVTTGSKVNLFGDVTVEKDELAEEAVSLAGSVRVDGEVSREVTAVGGSAVINGRVGGNVTAVGGNVRLGPHAVVDGDVSSVGGKIIRAPGARIHGKTSEVGMIPSDVDEDDDDINISFHPWSPFLSDTADFVWQLIWTGILGLLVCLCLLMAPRPMEKVERQLEIEPWVAVLVGLLTQVIFIFLFIVVTVLLMITIVGCVLFALYPFLFIAIGLALLLGYAAAAHQLGQFLETRLGRRFGSPYAVALVGVLALGLASILGRGVALGGGFLDFVAFPLLLLGFLVQYIATTMGIGGMVMARYGSRGGAASAIAPPPPPPAPVPYDPVLDGPDRPWEPAPPPTAPPPPEP